VGDEGFLEEGGEKKGIISPMADDAERKKRGKGTPPPKKKNHKNHWGSRGLPRSPTIGRKGENDRVVPESEQSSAAKRHGRITWDKERGEEWKMTATAIKKKDRPNRP